MSIFSLPHCSRFVPWTLWSIVTLGTFSNPPYHQPIDGLPDLPLSSLGARPKQPTTTAKSVRRSRVPFPRIPTPRFSRSAKPVSARCDVVLDSAPASDVWASGHCAGPSPFLVAQSYENCDSDDTAHAVPFSMVVWLGEASGAPLGYPLAAGGPTSETQAEWPRRLCITDSTLSTDRRPPEKNPACHARTQSTIRSHQRRDRRPIMKAFPGRIRPYRSGH